MDTKLAGNNDTVASESWSYIKLREFVRRTGMSKQTANYLCRAGQLPAVQLGSRWWVDWGAFTEKVDRQAKRRMAGAFLLAFFLLIPSAFAEVRTGTASWYSRASALAEGNSGVMANGQPMRDEDLLCASWDYPLGTRLKVTPVADPTRGVVCIVSDRGPSKRLYRKGRIVDLSPAAFQWIAPLSQGLVSVTVEPLNP